MDIIDKLKLMLKRALPSDCETINEAADEIERLRSVVSAADDLRIGIRKAGVKRNENIYPHILRYDAVRSTLQQKDSE